jgi:hypothetical protein
MSRLSSSQRRPDDDDRGIVEFNLPLTIRTWWQLAVYFCCVSLHRAILVGMGLLVM